MLFLGALAVYADWKMQAQKHNSGMSHWFTKGINDQD